MLNLTFYVKFVFKFETISPDEGSFLSLAQKLFNRMILNMKHFIEITRKRCMTSFLQIQFKYFEIKEIRGSFISKFLNCYLQIFFF